ncbi:hypothetical protein MMC24_007591 [Lignoscripta atroalba]|nr:hypothetical protein [Lignoscripta atroalba]
MALVDDNPTTSPLVAHLKSGLESIYSEPCPTVPNPPSCKKRASVALVIRFRPVFPHRAESSHRRPESSGRTFQEGLNAFFGQEWVQSGDPEILFIRRSNRRGDRWTGHVALPGGKRESTDESDQATAVRETLEEIGLDLNVDGSLFVGNLPERIVTTSWGKVPLMVLCPFVYLITSFELPPLQLQPSEVGSVHWVSLRALLHPALRTFEYCDVSDRLTRQGGSLARGVLRAFLGQMMFAAVRLVPTESLFCSSITTFLPAEDTDRPANTTVTASIVNSLFKHGTSQARSDRPLLLWGLTNGVLVDLLKLLPPHDTSALWTWPSFSPWDIRVIIWLVTYRFRKHKLSVVGLSCDNATPIIEEGLDAVGNSRKQSVRGSAIRQSGSQSGAIGQMIDGYYDLVRRAVLISLILRLGTCSAIATFLIKRFRRNT